MDSDFTPAQEELYRRRRYLGEVARLLHGAGPNWVPDIGECFNITITKEQRAALLKELKWPDATQ